MGVQRKHVNELCNNRRNVTAATALILARVFGNSPDFWLKSCSGASSVWEAMNSPRERERIERRQAARSPRHDMQSRISDAPAKRATRSDRSNSSLSSVTSRRGAAPCGYLNLRATRNLMRITARKAGTHGSHSRSHRLRLNNHRAPLVHREVKTGWVHRSMSLDFESKSRTGAVQ